MKNKGFTIVELLASVVILAILLGVAIPNILGVMTKQKAKTYVEDAKRLSTLAKTKFSTTNTIDKKKGVCFNLNFLDNGDFDEAPNGGKYIKELSYVYYEGKDYRNNDIYYVTLVECTNCKDGDTNYKNKDLRGISNVKYSTLINTDDYTSLVQGGNDLNREGMKGDLRCTAGYDNENTAPIAGSPSNLKEYRLDHVNCTNNYGDNIYKYREGQTWKQYLSSDVYSLAQSRKTYVSDYFFAEVDPTYKLYYYPCSDNSCTPSLVKLSDKIHSTASGHYYYQDVCIK